MRFVAYLKSLAFLCFFHPRGGNISITLLFSPRRWKYFPQLLIFPVFAQGTQDLGPEPAQFKHLETYFSMFLNTATTWGIITVFAMLVLGGIKYLTAGGDPKATESAQSTITYALLGLALLIGAWFILKFIEIFTGVKVTVFNITFD